MPKEFSRTERLGQLIQRELATMIQFEVKDPRLGLVTVNAVELSNDLSHAKVYVTVFADDETIKLNMEILNGMAGFLRKQLGRRIKIRITPELKFIYDKTIVEGNRLSKVIDDAVKSDDATSNDAASDINQVPDDTK